MDKFLASALATAVSLALWAVIVVAAGLFFRATVWLFCLGYGCA